MVELDDGVSAFTPTANTLWTTSGPAHAQPMGSAHTASLASKQPGKFGLLRSAAVALGVDNNAENAGWRHGTQFTDYR